MDELLFTAQVFFRDFEGFFQKEFMIYFELELTLGNLRRGLKERKAYNQKVAKLKWSQSTRTDLYHQQIWPAALQSQIYIQLTVT